MVMEKHRGSSSGHGELAVAEAEAEQVTIDIPEGVLQWLKLLDASRMSEEPDQQQPTRPRIQDVPSALRDKEMLKSYYEPMVVAFGPIHHNKLLYGEKVKLKLAGQFIKKSGIPREAAYKKIIRELQALNDCYQENAFRNFSGYYLPFMFLVDGCALLHFMVSIVGDNEDLLLHHVNYDFISFAKRDIFLLENQLPYRLLQLLINFIPKENTAWRGVFNDEVWGLFIDEEFIRKFTFIMSPAMGSLQKEQQPQAQAQPLHLLDLLHQNLTFIPPSQRDIKVSSFIIRILIKLTYRCLFYYSPYKYSRQATYRSAKELKSVGIGFKQSPTNSVRDVTFQQKFLRGALSLPSITVNDSSISMFLNLVAYEMCPDFKNDLEVTSYICFLNALIDHSEDVRELRQARILGNHLGSDEDVAKLFNHMATGLVPNPEIYMRTQSKMYKLHKNTETIRIWLAEMKEKYFSNPWTFLAVCGAIFGLVQGFIQAWFAVKSYYHPKKA